MDKEKFYCMDDGQGFDHKCVTFFDGRCSQKERCRFQMSETLNKYFTDKWASDVKGIEQSIKNEIAETLGLRSSEFKENEKDG